MSAKSRSGVIITGDVELDRELAALTAEEHPRSINAALRRYIRQTLREIVQPKVIELIAVDTGELEANVVIRALKRSRNRVGFWVGFPDPLFQGDTYYGGYIEFGWDHVGGMHIEADSYLRRALYPETDRIIARLHLLVRQWIDERNGQQAEGRSSS